MQYRIAAGLMTAEDLCRPTPSQRRAQAKRKQQQRAASIEKLRAKLAAMEAREAVVTSDM